MSNPPPPRRLRFLAPPSLGAGHAERAAARIEWFLGRYLAPTYEIEVRVADTYAELARLLSSGQADVGWTPPLIGARVEMNGGRALVRVVRGGAVTFRAALVCRRDRPVDPAALNGLRAVWVDRESTAGYLLPRAWVRSLGFNPDSVFSSERFAGSHRAALEELLGGGADLTAVFASAASAPPYTALDDLPAAERGRLSVIGLSEEAPNDVIMAAPGIDAETFQHLMRRLLAAVDDEEGSALLREVFHAQSLEPASEEGHRAMQDLVLATFGLASAPSACSNCGARVSPSARFCERCGAAVRRTSWQPPPAPAAAVADAPPASVGPAALAGAGVETGAWFEERKLATVLFGDLSDFTAISAGLEPDSVRELANECFEPIAAEVERRGGRIVKYIGDGVMAVFGVPLGSEDDPRRAVQAALAMMTRIAEVSRRTVERYGTPVNMRIGINTGWMMVGTVGARGHASLDVMGWTVNVASRIEGVAKPGEVLIGQATCRLVERAFETEPLGPVRLRGVPDPVQVHRVLRERPEEVQLSQRTAAEEPFLRERELSLLEGAFDGLARARRPRVVKLLGEAGLGKGRLVDEMARRLAEDARRPELLRATGVLGATDAATPMSLIERMLREHFGVRRGEPGAEARARVAAGVARAFGPSEEEAGRAAAEVLSTLVGAGAPSGDPAVGVPGQSPAMEEGPLAGEPAGEDAVLGALAGWIRRLAGERAACLLLTDLHWADERSLDLVERLPAALGDAAVLLVLSARPELDERRPRWGEDSRDPSAPPVTRIDLAPLSPADLRRFLAALLPPGAPERIAEELVARAEGSPELARELVRLLVDRGAIVLGDDGRPAAWRPERMGTMALPETVQGALQARLDGLPRIEREVLRLAAVVGRIFWHGAVEQVALATEADGARRAATASQPEVTAALESLQKKGLVRPSVSPLLDGEQELAFHTQALREITYEAIPRQARESAHLAVAAWLRERAALWQGAQAEIAAHLAAGGAAAEARAAYVRAARYAAAIWAHDDAARLYERSLLLGAGPERKRATVLRELALMRARAGRYQHALEALDAAAVELKAAGAPANDASFAWIELERSRVLKDCGKSDEQLAALDRALGIVAGQPPSVLAVHLYATRAFARFEQGDATGARADCEHGLATGEELAQGAVAKDAEPVAGWRQAMARLNNTLGGIRLYSEGDLDGAESCYRRALELRRAAADQQGELDALINIGAIAFERRDYTGATLRFAEGLSSARRAAWVKYIAVCASNLGQAKLAAGEPGAAVTLLEEAEALARQSGLLEVLADGTRALAEARLRCGAHKEALADAERSVEHARRAGIPRFEGAAHAVAMECLLAGMRQPGADHAAVLAAARGHLEAAVRILEASGHRTAAAEIAELRSELERAERGWSPMVVLDRGSQSGPKGS